MKMTRCAAATNFQQASPERNEILASAWVHAGESVFLQSNYEWLLAWYSETKGCAWLWARWGFVSNITTTRLDVFQVFHTTPFVPMRISWIVYSDFFVCLMLLCLQVTCHFVARTSSHKLLAFQSMRRCFLGPLKWLRSSTHSCCV